MTNDNSDDKQKCMSPPNEEDIQKPFFAYGIFKPGQLAFSEIEDYVDEISYSSIDYQMYIRDGVPLIDEKKNNNFKTYGYLIKFKKGSEKKLMML